MPVSFNWLDLRFSNSILTHDEPAMAEIKRIDPP